MAIRRVLAYMVAITLEACHPRKVIEQAFARWGKPDIVNTDHGSQTTATEISNAVLGQGCQLGIAGVAPGGTTSSPSGYGAASSTSGCTSRPTTA